MCERQISEAANEGQGPDRPSRHGAILGRALARLEQAGRAAKPDLPDLCATCGLREGTLANMTAGTALMALNCVLGTDPDDFACHHGMNGGRPTKLCAGYVAAKAAPWETVRAIMRDLKDELDGMSGVDEIRAEFDAWWDRADPERRLDIYQLSRLFERQRATQETRAA